MLHYLKPLWKLLTCEPSIDPDKYEISDLGDVRQLNKPGEQITFRMEERIYHSTNGYDFVLLTMKNRIPRLFAIDTLVAKTFIPIPKELVGKPLKIVHKDGDLKNCAASNLSWEEDVEEWFDCICPIIRKDGVEINLIPNRYRISSHNRVYSNFSKKFMQVSLDSEDYPTLAMVYAFPDGSPKVQTVKFYRLVAYSLNLPGRTKERNRINHINGIPSDCRLKNLEWVTNQENVVHSFKTQLEVNPAGEAHPRAKFTNHQRECYYEIMIALKDIEPYKVAEIIASRLPAITKDDVKYAKQVLKKQRGVIFPLLDFRHPHKYTQEESDELYEIANRIFDKYNIKEKEGYVNEHRKKPQG